VTSFIQRAGEALNHRHAQFVQGSVMLFDGSLIFEGSISVSSKICVGQLRLSSEGVDVASSGTGPFEGSLFT
jgi:hypothetical protein